MLTLADLVALEERIKSDLTRLQGELSAVRVLKERFRTEGAVNATMQPSIFEGLESPEKSITFAESVRQAIKTFGSNEFLVANVESVMKARGVRLPPKNVRPRIAMVLQDLTKKGVVIVSQKGEGNTPHRYRLLDQPEGEDEKGEGVSAGTLPPLSRRIFVRGRTPTLAA